MSKRKTPAIKASELILYVLKPFSNPAALSAAQTLLAAPAADLYQVKQRLQCRSGSTSWNTYQLNKLYGVMTASEGGKAD